MNTANLQLEGLYLALASLIGALRRHDVLSESAIEAALEEAERCAAQDAERRSERSAPNIQAVLFPIRLLRLANGYAGAELPPFSEFAAQIGMNKDEADRSSVDGE